MAPGPRWAVRATSKNQPLRKRFLKPLSETLEHIKIKYSSSGCTSVSLFYEDESRFGLLSVFRRMITARGVPFLHCFDNLYLVGAFSPFTGCRYLLGMPQCNSSRFQAFLDHLSTANATEFKILVLDNGAFHHARCLEIPTNIALVFLPPYLSELNPAEKMWRYCKDRISIVAYETLDSLQTKTTSLTNALTANTVMSICGNQFYKNTFQSNFTV